MAAADVHGELVGLRNFLQTRCGTLTEAFARLDLHSVGQVTSDDFVKGLEKLGYKETQDRVALFQMLDHTRSGLVSINDFFKSLGASVADDADVLNFSGGRSMSQRSLGSRSEREDKGNVWATAQRVSSDSDLRSRPRQRSNSERPPAIVLSTPTGTKEWLHNGGGLSIDTSAFSQASSASVSGEVIARLARLEEALELDRKTQCDAEKRLVSIVTASIAEQLDALRQTLIEEHTQRQVDITGVRAMLETLRTAGQRAVTEAKQNLRQEMREQLSARGHRPELTAALEAAEVADEGEIDEAERATLPVLLGAKEKTPPPTGDEKAKLSAASSSEVAFLRDEVGVLRGTVGSFADTVQQLRAEVSDQAWRCAKMKGQLQHCGEGPLCGTVQVEQMLQQRLSEVQQATTTRTEALVQARVGELRQEFETSLEQEQERAFKALGRMISAQLESAVPAAGPLNERLGRLEAQVAGMASSDDAAAKITELRKDVAFSHERIKDEVENAIRKLSVNAAAPAPAPAASEDLLTALVKKLEGFCAKVDSLCTNCSENQDHWNSLRGDVDVLTAQVSSVLAGSDTVNECIAALRGDVVVLSERLKEDVCANAENLCRRVQNIEDDLRNSRGSTAQVSKSSDSGAKLDVLSVVERLCSDRLVDIDLALARIGDELKVQGVSINALQRRQEKASLGDEVNGKLQALLAKVDDNCVKTFGVGPDLLGKEAPMAVAIAALEHAAGCIDNPRPLAKAQEETVLRRSSAPSVSSTGHHPALDITVPSAEKESKDNSNTIAALLEENMRLREDNVAMREIALDQYEEQLIVSQQVLAQGPPLVAGISTSPVVTTRSFVATSPPLPARNSVGAPRQLVLPTPPSPQVVRSRSAQALPPQALPRAPTQPTAGLASPAGGLRRSPHTASGTALPGAAPMMPAGPGRTVQVIHMR